MQGYCGSGKAVFFPEFSDFYKIYKTFYVLFYFFKTNKLVELRQKLVYIGPLGRFFRLRLRRIRAEHGSLANSLVNELFRRLFRLVHGCPEI